MNVRLDLLPRGYFVAAARTIGSSDEELTAIELNPNSVTAERIDVLNVAMHHAMACLYHVCPQGLG